MDEKIVSLLQKYRANTLSDDEYAQLKSWMEEREENSQYMATFISLYKIQHMQEAYRLADPGKAYRAIQSRYRKRKNVKRIRYFAAAACLIALISTITLLLQPFGGGEDSLARIDFQRSGQPVLFTSTNGEVKSLENGGELITQNSDDTAAIYHTVQTQRGGNFKLILPDQSVVWLNADTKVRYAADFLHDRTLELSGEAYFDVQKNGSAFYVKGGGNTIRVLGTTFNVSAYASKPVVTTLVHGAVEVSNLRDKLTLAPNEQATSATAADALAVKTVNTAIYTSWIDGIFEFQSANLADIMEQLAQWYDIEVEYQDPKLKNVHFTGSLFRDNSIAYSLQIIQEISEVKFRTQNGKLYVYK
ncbi:FecR family protein [Sphingobacterium oryzagri]|uniref:FecR family protein n=1 Tax=Sphingobacterium oryzagri TaxID=3025669 RepID=A0ABY7WCY1_9SPHI|nr:FecR family protein [Sphingobacterium sp. KACC 22765]WDF67325.1 FecR family protein [Sphingobacterium sp. KACC 22765]